MTLRRCAADQKKQLSEGFIKTIYICHREQMKVASILSLVAGVATATNVNIALMQRLTVSAR